MCANASCTDRETLSSRALGRCAWVLRPRRERGILETPQPLEAVQGSQGSGCRGCCNHFKAARWTSHRFHQGSALHPGPPCGQGKRRCTGGTLNCPSCLSPALLASPADALHRPRSAPPTLAMAMRHPLKGPPFTSAGCNDDAAPLTPAWVSRWCRWLAGWRCCSPPPPQCPTCAPWPSAPARDSTRAHAQ